MKLNYDATNVVEADVGSVNSVSYTVKFKDYSDIAAPLKATFDFEIICPSNLVSSTLDQPTRSLNFYDIANLDKLLIRAP